jgi:hypothetical protein
LFFSLQLPQSKTPSKLWKIKIKGEKKKSLDNTKIETHINPPYSTSNTNKNNPTSSMDPQTSPQGLLHISFSPPSVSDKLHILTVPSMQFHTRLNGLQQLAHWLPMISETLSNTVHLEMGFKHEKLQHNNSEILDFTTRKCDIVVTNDK